MSAAATAAPDATVIGVPVGTNGELPSEAGSDRATLALAGFDDIPIARYVVPSLTTMRVNIPELGAHAMRLLLDMQNGEDVSERLAPLVPELIVRESSRRDGAVLPTPGRAGDG